MVPSVQSCSGTNLEAARPGCRDDTPQPSSNRGAVVSSLSRVIWLDKRLQGQSRLPGSGEAGHPATKSRYTSRADGKLPTTYSYICSGKPQTRMTGLAAVKH